MQLYQLLFRVQEDVHPRGILHTSSFIVGTSIYIYIIYIGTYIKVSRFHEQVFFGGECERTTMHPIRQFSSL